jgi:hypothetical protein
MLPGNNLSGPRPLIGQGFRFVACFRLRSGGGGTSTNSGSALLPRCRILRPPTECSNWKIPFGIRVEG